MTTAVILYYDHLITFDDEYRYIWARLKSPASWLFLLNRFVAFVYVCAALLVSRNA